MSQGQQLVRIDEEIVQPISEEIESHVINNIEELLEECSIVILSDYGKGLLTKKICKKIILHDTKITCYYYWEKMAFKKCNEREVLE